MLAIAGHRSGAPTRPAIAGVAARRQDERVGIPGIGDRPVLEPVGVASSGRPLGEASGVEPIAEVPVPLVLVVQLFGHEPPSSSSGSRVISIDFCGSKSNRITSSSRR